MSEHHETAASTTRVEPAPNWPRTIFLVMAIILLLGTWYRGCQADSKKTAAENQRKAAEYAATHPREGGTKILIPRFDGFTPCSPSIDFVFELDTQGDPVSMKFRGVSKPVFYSGKGTMRVPDERLSGSVEITSADPQKQARVRIWEVRIVQYQ